MVGFCFPPGKRLTVLEALLRLFHFVLDNAVICAKVQHAKYFIIVEKQLASITERTRRVFSFCYAPFDTPLLGHTGNENTTNPKAPTNFVFRQSQVEPVANNNMLSIVQACTAQEAMRPRCDVGPCTRDLPGAIWW